MTFCFYISDIYIIYVIFQRDLDFSVDVEFRGELSEMQESLTYKMR